MTLARGSGRLTNRVDRRGRKARGHVGGQMDSRRREVKVDLEGIVGLHMCRCFS
jgi:hypothetical protein